MVMGMEDDRAEVEILTRVLGPEGESFVKQKLPIVIAIDEIFQQSSLANFNCLVNPLWRWINSTIGTDIAFTDVESNAKANYESLRSYLLQFVRNRAAGKEKSCLQDGNDLVS